MRTRMMMMSAVAAGLALAISAAGAGEPDPRASYRFVVGSAGFGHVEFSGSYSVNGKEVRIGPLLTPFEFKCEAGTTITGAFRTTDSRKMIKVSVYDSGYSRKKPAAWAKANAVRFAWAQPGAGPRTVEMGEPAPESRPPVE